MAYVAITPISQENLAVSVKHREEGYCPSQTSSLKMIRAISRGEIVGANVRETCTEMPIQSMFMPTPAIWRSRSSTVTERLVTFLVARESARELKTPMFCPQLRADSAITLSVKADLLNPNTPRDAALESAAFTYLNGQSDEVALPWADIEAEFGIAGIVELIKKSLSLNFKEPHIPVNTLYANMQRDDAGVATPTVGAGVKTWETRMPVVFIRALRIGAESGAQCDYVGHYEPQFFAIIGDVLFVPYDSTTCNVPYVHALARRHAMFHGVKHVRVIVTLDLAENYTVACPYF